MSVDLELEGRVVLITGASGGIGQALASAFAEAGCRLALLAGRRLDALEAWVAAQPWADIAACGAVDLTDDLAVNEAIRDLRGRCGRLDHAVANAGIWPEADLPLHHMPAARVREVIDVDLLGALWTARAFLGGLAEDGPAEGGASLTFIGSTAGAFGEPGHVAYAAAKSALHGVVRSLSAEIVGVDPGGRVNLVEPGWTATPMAQGAMDDARQVERSLSTTPLRRVGRPEDVAGACLALASPRLSGHVTGQALGVHGGMQGRRLW